MRAAGLDVHMQTVRGYGEGLLEALHLAKGDVIIEFNPDGNSIPEDIPRIIAKISEGYDLVIGSRLPARPPGAAGHLVTPPRKRLFPPGWNAPFCPPLP